MPKFLLIYPTLISEAPMTLAMLSGVLKKEGWETKALINTFRRPLKIEDFVDEVLRYKPDVIGISMLTFEVLNTYKLIRTLKTFGFPVIAGGPHPTDCPEEVTEAGAILIQGEAENKLRNINGPVDLDTLPLPDLEIFDLDLFREDDGLIKGFHRIYTSRGCPGRCTFCDWQVFGQNIRFYSVKTIIQDIKRRIDKYGITTFSIADDCFTINHKRVYEFCNKVKELGIVWRANSRANLVNLELLKAMKESGCHSIAFGLESGDPETLKKIKKFVTLEQNIKAPWLAHEAGLEVYGCLMTGFPWETPKSVENNINFIHKIWDAVSLFQVSGSLMPFPGSAIYRQYAKEYGFEKYWLKQKYQKAGIQVYQNAENPYKVSTFYQRLLFDDTYIQEDYFFKYSDAYKNKVQEMVLEIGRHNLEFMFKNKPIKQKLFFNLAKLSMLIANKFPNLEKQIMGTLFKGRSQIEQLRDKRRGFVKNK